MRPGIPFKSARRTSAKDFMSEKLEDIEAPVPGGNAQMEWVSDIMAEMIRRLDLKYIAMNPGASYRGLHDSLVNYLGNRNPQMLLTLHEEHAVSIAHGYARVTDAPMGCLLHSNVGLMHGLMAIFNAWVNRAPIVMFGATGPVDADIRRPWVDWVHTAQDQGALLRNYTKWDDQPTSAPALCESFLRAFQIACTAPKGPTYVCLDAGLQETRLDGPFELPDPARFGPGPAPAPSQDTLDEMARLLAGARRPLILVGRVSRKADDWDRRIRLAEALGAKVISELRAGAGFPTEHPLHVYPPRYTPARDALDLMRSADVILALDSFDLAGWFKLMAAPAGPKATVIHCSVDSYNHNGWGKDHLALPAVDLRVLAEPDAAVKLLLPLAEREMQGKPKKWDAMTLDRQAQASTPHSGGAITNHDLADCLAELREGRKFTFTRLPIGWASDRYHFREPLDYLGTDGGGGLGSGPGMAVGVGLALRGTDRIAITVIGDGDFTQGATALWTAAHYRIPVLVIVANNRSNFNDEIHQGQVARERGRPVENKWIGMRLSDPNIDLAALARAQGVEAEGPIGNVAELRPALEKAIAAVEGGRPYFLDILVEPGYASLLMVRASGHGASA
jgi:thiamine pyrophosphate-dependent acetolactate synthase large subunit-like protein